MDIDEICDEISSGMQVEVRNIGHKQKDKLSKIDPHTRHLVKSRRGIHRENPGYKELNNEIIKNIRRNLRNYNTNLIKTTIEANKSMKILISRLSNGRLKVTKTKNQGDL